MALLVLMMKKKVVSQALQIIPFHQAHHFFAANKINDNGCGLISSPLPPTNMVRFSTTETPFVVDYLINSRGISPEKALKASKYIAHITTPTNPDSVIHFLKSNGWNDTEINNLITRNPRLLAAKLEETLKPRMKAVQDLGFSGSDLIQFFSYNPSAFCANLQSKVEFWRTMLGSNKRMLQAFKIDHFLLSSNLEKRIMPNIAYLRECGLSDLHIATMLLATPRVIHYKLDVLKKIASWTEEFIPRGSGMFPLLLRTFCCISRSTFDSKCNLFRSFGWSEDQIVSVIRRSPLILTLSVKKLCDTIDFLVKEVRFEMSYIAQVPGILGYSLEKRLIPRHYVLKTLKSMELPLGGANLCSAVKLTNENFLKKFVLPHEAAVPGLREAYDAACDGKVPV